MQPKKLLTALLALSLTTSAISLSVQPAKADPISDFVDAFVDEFPTAWCYWYPWTCKK